MTTDCQSCGTCDACLRETRLWLCGMAVEAVAKAPRSAAWCGSICRAAIACDERDVADMLIRYVPASDWTTEMRELFRAAGRSVPDVDCRRPSSSFADETEVMLCR